MNTNDQIFFAGQMTGVEGYVESAASGLMAGVNAARIAAGKSPVTFPCMTCHGALAHYITTCEPTNFQPMNINFGLLPPLTDLPRRTRKPQRKLLLAENALETLEHFRKEHMKGALTV